MLIVTNPAISSGMLSGLNTALDELPPLAAKIATLRKETLDREAAVLKAIHYTSGSYNSIRPHGHFRGLDKGSG